MRTKSVDKSVYVFKIIFLVAYESYSQSAFLLWIECA